VRRGPEQDFAFPQRLADEPDRALLEVAQAAVDQLGRGRAGVLARSSRSTSSTRSPRSAASRAIAAPLIPPPMIEEVERYSPFVPTVH
jgi:hypothetical protein